MLDTQLAVPIVFAATLRAEPMLPRLRYEYASHSSQNDSRAVGEVANTFPTTSLVPPGLDSTQIFCTSDHSDLACLTLAMMAPPPMGSKKATTSIQKPLGEQKDSFETY